MEEGKPNRTENGMNLIAATFILGFFAIAIFGIGDLIIDLLRKIF